MNKKKFDSFGDFVLNDRKIVMPFLMTLSTWVGVVFTGFLTFLGVYYEIIPMAIIFGVMELFAIRRLYRHYKVGGFNFYKGFSTNEIVWNKKLK